MPTVTVIEPTIQEQTGTKIRVAAYCRVSSSSDDQLNSYAAQVTYYSSKFENSDTEILADLYADEGITGTCDTKRIEFQRMITDCRRGKIDRIYTKSISRFARNTRDCLKYVRELKSLGITIFFEKENIDTAKVTDEMMITIMGGLAQEESLSISENMKWSLRRQMANGTIKQTSAPYGYTLADGQLIVNPEQAEIIRNIYRMFLSGMGYRVIVQELNKDGVPKNDKGETWTISAIAYILKNERYIGDSLWQKNYNEGIPVKRFKNYGKYAKYYIPDTHEPIIDRSTFETAQRLIAEHQTESESAVVYPLTQKIVCSHCNMTYRHRMRGKSECWVCRQHEADSTACLASGVTQKQIYDAFIRLVNKLHQHYTDILLPMQMQMLELKLRKFSGNAHVIDIHREIAKLREQAHVIAKLRTKEFLSEAKYQEQSAELNRKIAKLQKELQRLTKSDDENDTLRQIEMLVNFFENRKEPMMTFDEESFAAIVDKIIINSQNQAVFCLIGGLHITEQL